MAKPTKPTRRKSSVKPSASKPKRAGVPQPHGGVLVPGAGGGPQPGAGRPKDEFKEWCKGLLDDTANRQQVETILGNKDHPAYATMWKSIADRAHGKPAESVTVTGEVTHKHQVWRFGEHEVAF